MDLGRRVDAVGRKNIRNKSDDSVKMREYRDLSRKEKSKISCLHETYEKISDILPTLLMYIEEFLELHKTKQELEEDIEDLFYVDDEADYD